MTVFMWIILILAAIEFFPYLIKLIMPGGMFQKEFFGMFFFGLWIALAAGYLFGGLSIP
jgi:hypothetical protein